MMISSDYDKILRVSKTLRENNYLPLLIFPTENAYSKLFCGKTFLIFYRFFIFAAPYRTNYAPNISYMKLNEIENICKNRFQRPEIKRTNLTALLKLEITVSFLWLSLPVHSGSLKRIYYSKLYSLTHTLSFECFDCS